MNDSLYNPDSMSKEDIKTLFVARQPLLDELVSTVKNQPQGAGVQHLLIIAPRGMGKTTMLLMLQFAAEDDKALSKNWQAVRFPEESYGITELADFWLKVLEHLGEAASDKDFEAKIEEIENRFTKSEDLREAAWALVKDWSAKHKKRILLLVDNFDMILDQIGNDTEQARLRDVLMNDGTVMLVGGAPSYFHQIQNYEQPLYNFFKIHNLGDLKFPDIEELLRRRAELDEIENIEELLQKNRSRIKALETFTGGNPRLVLMLYRIIISSDMTEVTKGLEQLLDAVTPLYKDKTEKLPNQQKKIINEIAQYSLEKREGISPTEIAKRIRMTPNQVSSQLKRLAENGYVKALNIRGRSSFYVLSEPLYAIWAQMRFGRNAREKRNWLVQILKALFDVQEIQKEIEKLGERVKQFKLDGRDKKARGTLEYMLCLFETHPILVQENFDLAVNSYLELKEISSLKEILDSNNLIKLPNQTLFKLRDVEMLKRDGLIILVRRLHDETLDEMIQAYSEAKKLFDAGETKKSVKSLDKIIKFIDEVSSNPKVEESENIKRFWSSFDFIKAISYQLKGDIFILTKGLKEADNYYDKSLKIFNELSSKLKKDDFLTKGKLRILIFKLSFNLLDGKEKEALDNFAQCIETIKAYNSAEVGIGTLTNYLISATGIIGSNKIRKIISRTNSEDLFFSLIRAIDYLETKDETLIEKLSPEVRLVVEETIRTLQMVAEEKPEPESKQKAKNKKDRKSEKSLALSE